MTTGHDGTVIHLTEPQERLLARIAAHGLRRRVDRYRGIRHWIPDETHAAPRRVVEKLADARLIKVIRFGMPDELGISDLGKQYLADR